MYYFYCLGGAAEYSENDQYSTIVLTLLLFTALNPLIYPVLHRTDPI